jgi:Flp pilus assembly protein TadG
MMVLFGILDFCRMAWLYNGMSNLAHEGTRFAAVRGKDSLTPATASAVTAAVTTQAIGYASSNLTVTTTWTPDNKPGSVVTVKVSYPFNPIGPYIPAASFTLTSTSKLLIVQ